jgi:hypothetical protein
MEFSGELSNEDGARAVAHSFEQLPFPMFDLSLAIAVGIA